MEWTEEIKPPQMPKAPTPQYARERQQRNIPIKIAVLEKYNTLKKTLVYLLIGLGVTLVTYAFPTLITAGVAAAFFILTIFLTKKEITRLEKKYLK